MPNFFKNWWQRQKKLLTLRQVAKSEPEFYASIPRIIRISSIDKILKDEKTTLARVEKLRTQADGVEKKFAENVKGDFIDDSFAIVRTRLKREQPKKWRRFFKGWRKQWVKKDEVVWVLIFVIERLAWFFLSWTEIFSIDGWPWLREKKMRWKFRIRESKRIKLIPSSCESWFRQQIFVSVSAFNLSKTNLRLYSPLSI